MTDCAWLPRGVDAMEAWQARYGAFATHPRPGRRRRGCSPRRSAASSSGCTTTTPFGHPATSARCSSRRTRGGARLHDRDARQPQQPRARRRPRDGGDEGGRRAIAAMFGLPSTSGTSPRAAPIANLEALWVARESHPGKAIALQRRRPLHALADVRRARRRGIAVRVDADGRMDLDHLDAVLATGRVGTVVATSAPPGSARPRPRRRDRRAGSRGRRAVRSSTRRTAGSSRSSPTTAPTAWRRRRTAAIAGVDSVVVDPHKHGQRPYGCGAVLFADPSVGRFYVHDSPYTLLQLRRAAPRRDLPRVQPRGNARRRRRCGSPLEVLPLTDAGLGQVLRAGRRGRSRGPTCSRVGRARRRTSVRSSTSSPTCRGGRRPRQYSLSAVDAASEARWFHGRSPPQASSPILSRSTSRPVPAVDGGGRDSGRRAQSALAARPALG